MLPKIIAQTSGPRPPGWRTRVVPNLYPLVGGAAAPAREGNAQADGQHEVIIEHPRHDVDLPDMSGDELGTVVDRWCDRYCALWKVDGVRWVVVFRNRGEAAGASLAHPHSQVVALDSKPELIERIERRGEEYYRQTGACLLCRMIGGLGSHQVAEDRFFSILVPDAASAPFETWILPRTHQSSISEMSAEERDGLADVIRRLLGRLRQLLGPTPYNLAFESFPEPAAPHLHWRLRVVPSLSVPGGFELGTGVSINPSLPEEDAGKLRDLV
jgi:UDPglucose--hexose-1-phosphate uridylyltransferase